MENSQLPFGFNRVQLATAIAVLFHAIGLIGILFFNRSFFVQTTFVNLLLMFILIGYTQTDLNKNIFLFILIVFGVGMIIEMIGTQTGYLFGDYA